MSVMKRTSVMMMMMCTASKGGGLGCPEYETCVLESPLKESPLRLAWVSLAGSAWTTAPPFLKSGKLWEGRHKATWISGIQTPMAPGLSTAIIWMIQWTWTMRLSTKNSLALSLSQSIWTHQFCEPWLFASPELIDLHHESNMST